MTDEEKLDAALKLDEAYARAAAEADDDADERKLDAYGHMTWTVGNEDWVACFDAIRVASGIAYHVVVDCESGGFTDTTESGTVPVEEAVEKLASLPWSYADSCLEQYCTLDDGEDYGEVSTEDVQKCADRWEAHLRELAAQPAPEPDEEPWDEYGELRKAALDHRGQP